MNREEAAEFTRKLLARAEINAFPKTPKTINNIPVFYFEAVLSALCGPQPDPSTGLDTDTTRPGQNKCGMPEGAPFDEYGVQIGLAGGEWSKD